MINRGSSVSIIIVVLILCLTGLGILKGLSQDEITRLTTFKVYYIALFIALLVRFFYATKEKSFGLALVLSGLIIIMIQGFYIYGTRFQGDTAPGVGEPLWEYFNIKAGPFSSPPKLPVVLRDVKEDKREVTISVDGREKLKVHWMASKPGITSPKTEERK